MRIWLGMALGGIALLAPAPVSAQGDTLRALAAARGIDIGAAVDVRALASEADYAEVLEREFSMVVGENAFKWENIHLTSKLYYFDDTDAIVAFAEANGMKVRGHTLVWHNQNPSWLARNLKTRDEAIAALKDHIQTVVGHYKGRIVAWDVVNEAVDDSTGELRESPWLTAIGPDYIALAFQFAREADPDAKLYYNDYSAEGVGGKGDAVYELVKGLKEQGVPIDGVGWQGHFQSSSFIMDMKDNGRRLAELGLEVSITELDVRIPIPVTDLMLEKQAKMYAKVTEICLALPNCKAIVAWGFTDKHSWVPGFFSGEGAALPFDESYTPKPAYEAIRAALQK
ncbi:MAG: endo-1,4-beta-xylanase [Devosia sp.]